MENTEVMTVQDSRELLADIWWIILIRGIALLLLGWATLTNPGITAVIVIQFTGAFWLVDGIFTIVKSIRGHKSGTNWGWGVAGGIFSIIAASVIFVYPFFSTLTLTAFIVYLIAFSAVISGTISIVTGIKLRKQIEGELSMILGGIATFGLGVFILLINPLKAIGAFILLMGILAIVFGILLIIQAFKIHSEAKKAGKL